MRILIVDDSPLMRKAIRTCLADAGYDELDEAASVAEAVPRVLSDPPALVLTDFYMPDLTGMDLLKILKAQRLPAAIGFLTSETHPRLLETAMREGAAFVLNKPPSSDNMRETLSGLDHPGRSAPLWKRLLR